jgi:hypothetical protein
MKIKANLSRRGIMPFIKYRDTNARNAEEYTTPMQVIIFPLQFPGVPKLIPLNNRQSAIGFWLADENRCVSTKYYSVVK